MSLVSSSRRSAGKSERRSKKNGGGLGRVITQPDPGLPRHSSAIMYVRIRDI